VCFARHRKTSALGHQRKHRLRRCCKGRDSTKGSTYAHIDSSQFIFRLWQLSAYVFQRLSHPLRHIPGLGQDHIVVIRCGVVLVLGQLELGGWLNASNLWPLGLAQKTADTARDNAGATRSGNGDRQLFCAYT
jgi:hypothetical protein